MVAEAQYIGIDIGYAMRYPGSLRSARDTWPWVGEIQSHDQVARHWFDYLEVGFGSLFALELLLKMLVLRCDFLRDRWNGFDFVLVGIWCIKILEVSGDSFVDTTNLRIIRIVRLIRIARIWKTAKTFDSLQIFVASIASSISVLFWGIVLLVLIQLATALFLSYMLDDYMSDSHNDMAVRHNVYKYFGTFSRSFLTMFELTLGNWIDVARMLAEGVDEWWVAFAVSYKLVFGFAVLKVITAVFLCETMKVAASDENLLELQMQKDVQKNMRKMQRLFPKVTLCKYQTMDRDECEQLLKHRNMRIWLEALDIEPSLRLFDLLDPGSGQLTVEEFVSGITRLGRPARYVDVARQVGALGELVYEGLASLHKVRKN